MKILKIATLSIVVCLFAMMAASGDNIPQLKPGEEPGLSGGTGGPIVTRKVICKVRITVKAQDTGKGVGAAMVTPDKVFNGFKTANSSGLAEFTISAYTLDFLKKSPTFDPKINFNTSGNALYGNGAVMVDIKDLSKDKPIKTGTIILTKKSISQPGGPEQ